MEMLHFQQLQGKVPGGGAGWLGRMSEPSSCGGSGLNRNRKWMGIGKCDKVRSCLKVAEILENDVLHSGDWWGYIRFLIGTVKMFFYFWLFFCPYFLEVYVYDMQV